MHITHAAYHMPHAMHDNMNKGGNAMPFTIYRIDVRYQHADLSLPVSLSVLVAAELFSLSACPLIQPGTV